MTEETPAPKSGKLVPVSVVVTLLASLSGNGYFGYQSKTTQDDLAAERTAAVEQQASMATLKGEVESLSKLVGALDTKLAAARETLAGVKANRRSRRRQQNALEKRFEDHLTAFVSSKTQVDVGLQGIRAELGSLKTTLITIVTKLR